MRNLNKYDVVFVDIDSTLVYGLWTKLMHHTWNMFRSDMLSALLMFIQNKFNLFRVNKKLLYALQNYRGDIIFITVRRSCASTREMITRICKFTPTIYELGTDNGAEEKLRVAKEVMYARSKRVGRAIMIDDNNDIKGAFFNAGFNVLDPVGMYEGLVG